MQACRNQLWTRLNVTFCAPLHSWDAFPRVDTARIHPSVKTHPPNVIACPRAPRPRRSAASWALALSLLAAVGAHAESQPAGPAGIAALRAEAAAYEHGEGVQKDGLRAAVLYCEAARLGDAEAQFALGWMYANGRGVLQDDGLAGLFLHMAARQGHEQAQRLLRYFGDSSAMPPPCMGAVAAAAPAAPESEAEAPRAPKAIVDIVTRLAPEYRINPKLALAVISAESNFDPSARSPKNAQGLMQLIPETSERFNVKKPFDPVQNIRGGLAYLRWLLAYFEGDVALVAAGYNAGEGVVNKYRGVPPYAETRDYVQRILRFARITSHPFDASITEPSPQMRAMRETKKR